jgi:hypothetical protein
MDDKAKGEKQCPRCGARFVCGMVAGESHCWCADLPNVMPMTETTYQGCLCPACLREFINLRLKSKREESP